MRAILLILLLPFFMVPCLAQDQSKAVHNPFDPSNSQPQIGPPAPVQARDFYSEGNLCLYNRDYKGALESFENALSLDSSNQEYRRAIKRTKHMWAGAFFSMALRKQIKNDLSGAIADYCESLSLENEPATHWYLGTALKAAGRLDESKHEFERSTGKMPYPHQEIVPVDLRKLMEHGEWQTPSKQMPAGFAGWAAL